MAAVVNNEKKLSDNEKIGHLKDYKNLPLLWNQNKKSPKKVEKTKATSELAEKHRLTSEGLKRVLHSFRTSMTREVKKKQEQHGYVSNWKFYEHMQFLEELELPLTYIYNFRRARCKLRKKLRTCDNPSATCNVFQSSSLRCKLQGKLPRVT